MVSNLPARGRAWPCGRPCWWKDGSVPPGPTPSHPILHPCSSLLCIPSQIWVPLPAVPPSGTEPQSSRLQDGGTAARPPWSCREDQVTRAPPGVSLSSGMPTSCHVLSSGPPAPAAPCSRPPVLNIPSSPGHSAAPAAFPRTGELQLSLETIPRLSGFPGRLPD